VIARWLLVLCLAGLAACASPRYQGPPSDHFDGQRFYNAEPFDKGWRDLLRYYRTREPGEWVRNLDIPPGPPPPSRVGPGTDPGRRPEPAHRPHLVRARQPVRLGGATALRAAGPAL
jgi:hypothetical protein